MILPKPLSLSRGYRARLLRAEVLIPALLLILPWLAYTNSFSGPFVFDDVPAILANPSIRDLSRISEVLSPPNDSGLTVNGRPLVNLSLAINYALGGQEVLGYHLQNLLIHLAATLALYGTARRLLAAARGELTPSVRATLGGGALAVLWSLHPLQTQAVTYVVQRAESLVGLFFLLTLYCFCRGQVSLRPRGWLIASVVACLLGVVSKEVIAAAPLLVLLGDRAFFSGTFRDAWRRNPAYYWAIFATWLPLAGLILGAQGRGGTVGFNIEGVTWWSYLLTQADAITRYLGLAFWPTKLVFDYGVGLAGSLAEVWWQGGVIVCLLVVTVVALVRWPRVGFLGAWFFLILAPSSSFVPIATETMAEHRMYLPLAAVLGLIVACGLRMPGRWSVALLGLTVAALASLTWRRNEDYQTAERLWQSSVNHYPQSARAQNNLGELFAKDGRLNEALKRIQEALRIHPTYLDALCNLSSVLSQINRIDEAMVVMEGLVTGHPRNASVLSTYGGVLYRQGRKAEAEVQFRRTLVLAPLHVDAHNNLGVCLHEKNQYEEAISHFLVVLSVYPRDGSGLYNLANALVKLGRPSEAEERLRQCLNAEPWRFEARNNLGALYAQRGLPNEAIVHFRKAVELAPQYADGLNNLGVMLAEKGQTAEAIALFERALRVRPDYPDAQVNLRRTREALQQTGRIP